MAQGVARVLKVLLICSDEAVKIDRVVNRDLVTVELAKQHLHQRYNENLAKWSKLYAQQWQEWVVAAGTLPASEPVDFWRSELYDVVIDTYSANRDETLAKVLDALKKKAPPNQNQ
jgi:cytidylate kinase